jgi:FtsH-binding integral membrane protein
MADNNNWPPYNPNNPNNPVNMNKDGGGQQGPYDPNQQQYYQNQGQYNQNQGQYNPNQQQYYQNQGQYNQNQQQGPYNPNQYGYNQQAGYNQYGYMLQPQVGVATSEAVFFQKIYTWMCAAVAVSALTGYLLANSYSWVRFLFTTSFAWIGVFIVQIGLVLAINYLVNKVSSAAIKCMFLLFAVSMGATISVVLLVYPSPVISKAFFCAAGVYGAMAVYGLVNKRSLQAWGSFLFMGLIGLIIASLVNFILGSTMMDFVICVVGVLIFAGLTAYDHQKLRVIHAGGFQDAETESKAVTMGALELYLDFINIFLFLVRLFGRE